MPGSNLTPLIEGGGTPQNLLKTGNILHLKEGATSSQIDARVLTKSVARLDKVGFRTKTNSSLFYTLGPNQALAGTRNYRFKVEDFRTHV
jgi:hypothetical protein